ncbi:hypothetical protein B9Z55_004918 [Caenorhabditis nigoni]|uniref:Uncharacterized protein n=1 Tax=Caenorhabditis nigoni TaxID=1611254 RepID=A0A2G5UYJ0_9PELO|nr:hypothetical protein B9Z55_004918 [Caenorhabditis nigoni]
MVHRRMGTFTTAPPPPPPECCENYASTSRGRTLLAKQYTTDLAALLILQEKRWQLRDSLLANTEVSRTKQVPSQNCSLPFPVFHYLVLYFNYRFSSQAQLLVFVFRADAPFLYPLSGAATLSRRSKRSALVA